MKQYIKWSMILGMVLGGFVLATDGVQTYLMYSSFGAMGGFMALPKNKKINSSDNSFVFRCALSGLPLFIAVLVRFIFLNKSSKTT